MVSAPFLDSLRLRNALVLTPLNRTHRLAQQVAPVNYGSEGMCVGGGQQDAHRGDGGRLASAAGREEALRGCYYDDLGLGKNPRSTSFAST